LRHLVAEGLPLSCDRLITAGREKELANNYTEFHGGMKEEVE
jgi:hypothetical protein